MAIYNNILETIGRTPVVRINKLAPDNIELYAKIESFNPMGSVKDRLALGVLDAAALDGTLKPGQTVVEATSGNTGIALAMACAQRGHPLVITMAENFSVERRRLMRFLGAKVVLTPASDKGTGMVLKAEELSEKHGWFLTRQFENEANAAIHVSTTGPEIVEDFSEIGLDYFIAGTGSGGTVKGVATVLKAHNPDIKILVCEPDNAPVLKSGIRKERNEDGSPSASHPHFRPHVMQGWSPDFIPPLVERAVEQGLIDGILPVPGKQALQTTMDLARIEGIFAGITSGATIAAAINLAPDLPKGSKVLCMIADTGERYLSTPLFASIEEDMNGEEIAISYSTTGFHFGSPPESHALTDEPANENSDEDDVEIDQQVIASVEEAVSNTDHPFVMFALEWCEFCWSLRDFFKAMKINYQAIDLDSVDYQKDNLGGDIREELKARTNVVTIPQLFIGDKFIGGCTEVFDAWNSGELQTLLTEAGVSFADSPDTDAYTFLPKWLHAR